MTVQLAFSQSMIRGLDIGSRPLSLYSIVNYIFTVMRTFVRSLIRPQNVIEVVLTLPRLLPQVCHSQIPLSLYYRLKVKNVALVILTEQVVLIVGQVEILRKESGFHDVNASSI